MNAIPTRPGRSGVRRFCPGGRCACNGAWRSAGKVSAEAFVSDEKFRDEARKLL
jgi:hypothetical protein